MSTYLELCQDLVREVGISGTGPSAVTGQIGELRRVVMWIADAYTEIQQRTDWRWLRRSFTLQTVEDQETYAFSEVTDVDAIAVISRFGKWRFEDYDDPPKIYLTSSGVAGQTWMIATSWESYKQIYGIGVQNSGQPLYITANPQDKMVIGPAPNGIYTLTGEFYRSAQILAADGDIPEMPTQFHKLIVYRAMEKYGIYEAAQEVVVRASKEGRRMLRQLENNQGARWRSTRPMA